MKGLIAICGAMHRNAGNAVADPEGWFNFEKTELKKICPLEVMFRYRDSQLQVGENLSYLFHLRPNIQKF